MNDVTVAQVLPDLHWLAERGALSGVAEIIAERRRQIERGDPPPGPYAAEEALDFAEDFAKAGALTATLIDLEGAGGGAGG